MQKSDEYRLSSIVTAPETSVVVPSYSAERLLVMPEQALLGVSNATQGFRPLAGHTCEYVCELLWPQNHFSIRQYVDNAPLRQSNEIKRSGERREERRDKKK